MTLRSDRQMPLSRRLGGLCKTGGFLTLVALPLAALLSLSACNRATPSATQVVARVDGEEISVHQINAALARAKGVNASNVAQVKQEILGGLVEQQLAINWAVKNKLDRSPAVVQAIEESRRDILARAAIDQITAGLPKVTDDEAAGYFNANPALFAQRRVFTLQELVLPKSTTVLEAVRQRVSGAKNLDELASWLRSQSVAFAVNGGVRGAEQIPLEFLPQLQAFKDGQIGLLEADNGWHVVHLLSSRAMPVTQEQAFPRIKQFLSNQRKADAIKREKDLMKASAKLEYLGEFVGGEAAFKARAQAQAKAAEEELAKAKAKAQADAAALAALKAQEQADAQAQAQARQASRAQARALAASGSAGVTAAPVDLEKGIKGLK